MNVSQGRKGQRQTTLMITTPRSRLYSTIQSSKASLTYACVISNASQNLETEAEEAAQVLEHFVNGTSRSNVYSSVVFEPTVPFVAPDYSNMYWSDSNDSQRQTEKVALIREIVDAMPELDMIHSLYKFFVTRCQGALGNVVHTPSFRKQAESLVSCLGLASPEAQAMALSNAFSMDTLACHLLAVRIPLCRVSSLCSSSPHCSLSSVSPFILHHLFLAGPLHL